MPCKVSGANNIQKTKKPEECRSSLPPTTPKATTSCVVFLSASRSAQNQLLHERNCHTRGLDCTNKRFTKHSIRKTTLRKLQRAGVSNNKIAAVTGHCSEQSLRDYAVADMDDHNRMSSILSKPTVLGDRTNGQPSMLNT